jgi:hypothetical protein
LLCLGCCPALMFIAAGVLGGGIVPTGLSWPEPLGPALLGAGVAGPIRSRARARRAGRERNVGDSVVGACADSGYGCAATTV